MKSSALLSYDIRQLEKFLLPGCCPTAQRSKFEAILAKKQQQLPIARRRELKRLARHLTYKADIYGPSGRIYAAEAKFTVSDDGRLFHGQTELDPAQLYDGHGQTIILPED